MQAVYGDYWTVVPLTYLSGERIVGVAVDDDLGNLHNNRYSPYLRAAAATPHFAWVVQAGSARQNSVLSCLAQFGVHYTTLAWADQVAYTDKGGRAFPWWNGGRCSHSNRSRPNYRRGLTPVPAGLVVGARRGCACYGDQETARHVSITVVPDFSRLLWAEKTDRIGRLRGVR